MTVNTEPRAAIELQHINLKLPLTNPETIDLGALIPVFHSWIQDQVCDELLLDVADYRHVPDGPGVVLIGHEADYSVDNSDARLGIRYNRKAVVEGSNQDRLAQAVVSTLRAAQRLAEDADLIANTHEIEIWINDRLLAPNREDTRKALDAALGSFIHKSFNHEKYALTFNTDPRRLLSARITFDREFSVPDVLHALGESPVI